MIQITLLQQFIESEVNNHALLICNHNLILLLNNDLTRK
jgi:hypothetical protein